jgi:hypothetical protein
MMLQITLFRFGFSDDFIRLIKLDCEDSVFGAGFCRQKQLLIFVNLLFLHLSEFFFCLNFYFQRFAVPPDEKEGVFGAKLMSKSEQKVLSALIIVKKVLIIFFPGNGTNLERIVLSRVLNGPYHFSNEFLSELKSFRLENERLYLLFSESINLFSSQRNIKIRKICVNFV